MGTLMAKALFDYHLIYIAIGVFTFGECSQVIKSKYTHKCFDFC